MINVTLKSYYGVMKLTIPVSDVRELENVIDAVDFVNALGRGRITVSHEATVEITDHDGDPRDLELCATEVDALGLDSSGITGDARFPYTYASLTWWERDRLRAQRRRRLVVERGR